MPAQAPMLQRRCACGGTPGPDGECAACKARRLGVQRRADAAGPQIAPPIVHDVLRGPGRALDPGVRGEMEARFEHDFSRVRVHTDAAAAASAKSVAARAYTVGSHVVFGEDRYAPGTPAGSELLAHELTHVVQQRAAGDVPAVLPVAPADDALERAAATASADGARVQRQDEGDTRFRRRDIRSQDAPTRTGQVWTGTIDRVEVQETFRRHPAEPPHTDQMADMSGGFHPVTVPGTTRPRGLGLDAHSPGRGDPRIRRGGVRAADPDAARLPQPGAQPAPLRRPVQHAQCGAHRAASGRRLHATPQCRSETRSTSASTTGTG